jgi:hypothetical protein
MRVVFLDIDGVLNSRMWDVKMALTGGNLLDVDPVPTIRLIQAIREIDAKVVLSSSWRRIPEYVDYLKSLGLPVIDGTPWGDPFEPRANQITAWLDSHPDVSEIAIVDDEPDAGVGFEAVFIHTDAKVGLTTDDAAKIVGLFT